MVESRNTVGWRIQTYGHDGLPLGEDHLAFLTKTFGIDPKILVTLNAALAVALDPRRRFVRPDLKPLLQKRGGAEVQKAIESVRVALEKLTDAKNRLEQVNFKNLYAHAAVPNPVRGHLQNLERASGDLVALEKFLAVMTGRQMVSSPDIHDKRRARDERRKWVCRAAFEAWELSGRKLSYTTDPITSERGGALVKFVNAVVGCVSDPPGQLKGDAIKLEIENLMADREELARR